MAGAVDEFKFKLIRLRTPLGLALLALTRLR
jgi:hypothetical protein